MAYDGWVEFDGIELVNLSRSAQLAEAMGIDMLWTDPDSVAWIQDALGGSDYDSVSAAPWYEANFAASTEFAGIIPLSLAGLDDSTKEATTVEYITDGGISSRPRSKTLSVVANVAVLASSERGAAYGKEWLDTVLSGSNTRSFCSGADLRYFSVPQQDGKPEPDRMHRRDVTLTRGTTTTRKRGNDCSVVWIVTFTWTANDPFEYSEEMPRFTGLGAAVSAPAGAPVLISQGSLSMVETECPAYDYTPIYDPLYPALVAPPTVPNFYPANWFLTPGLPFERYWVRVVAAQPKIAPTVPVLTLRALNADARMVRVSIWDSNAGTDEMCDPLWQAIITYLPQGVEFTIDGEQQAAYVWDGVSPQVRRTDNLLYTSNARPMTWPSFSDSVYRITLDVMAGFSEDSGVEMDLSLFTKTD